MSGLWPQGFGIHHAMNPDPYRGLFGADGPKYANDVAEIIQYCTSGRVAAFMAETIQVQCSTVLFSASTDVVQYRTVSLSAFKAETIRVKCGAV